MIRPFHPASSRRRGFALLITIVLVAFLVLILVGLATFTRVETQVAANAEDLGKARQSALTGLNIAIGKLQRYAGPDASVTARSDFAGAPLVNNNPYITGVWDTTAAGNNPVAWLVSGDEANPDDVADVGNPADAVTGPYDTTGANAWVYLVYNNSVDPANAGDRIRVTPQTIDASRASVPGLGSVGPDVPIGHYAYWVGDEGTKASINVAPPDLSTLNYNNSATNGDNWSVNPAADEMRERLRQFSQPYHRIDQFFGGMNYNQAATVAELRRVATLEQFRFVTNSDPAANQYDNFRASFHDMTPLAKGVLARTDAGAGAGPRLRFDLSSDTVAAGNSAVRSYLLQRPSGSTGLVATYPILGRSPVADYWVGPVLSEAGIFFGFTDNGGQLQLNMLISAELWNPYAATLDMGSNTLGVRVRVTNNMAFTATDTNGVPHTITIPAGHVFTEDLPTSPNLAAGEIKIFQTNNGGTMTDAGGDLSDSGFSSSAAFAFPPTSTGVPDGAVVIELFENSTNTVLQSFTLPTITGTTSGDTGLDAPIAGYGYELNRNLQIWTDLGLGASKDPRSATFVAADFENSGNWAAQAAANADFSTISGGAPLLPNSPAVILFDLPRQEVTSLAQLRHRPSVKPYGGGTPWDTQFVSTVPMGFAWDYRTQARPNPYIEVYEPPQAPAGEFDTPANKLTSLRDPDNAARYQLIRGAFNINSTSVKAWSAVLGASLSQWDTQADAAANITGAFFRTPHNAQTLGLANLVPSSTLTNASALTAVGRRLTAAEINALAQEIVDQLKLQPRPFYSLNAFASSTVLATAIADANLNASIANAQYQYAGGAITPGDILAAIAPFMSARSDTFKIRAYGDAANPVTGEVTGRVWCEAIVQRVPDLCPAPGHDSGANDAAREDVADVVDALPADFPFGRKFQIVSFRWLNSDDL